MDREMILGELKRTLAAVSGVEIAAAREAIVGAARVFVTGAGRSGLALKMAAMRLMHLGLAVHVVGELTTPAIGAGDVLVKELKKLGVSWVELHAGLDEQAQAGYSIETLLEAGRNANIPFSVAGGINADRIEGVEAAGAMIAVAGAAIYGAKDPGAAAKALREKIQQLGQVNSFVYGADPTLTLVGLPLHGTDAPSLFDGGLPGALIPLLP